VELSWKSKLVTVKGRKNRLIFTSHRGLRRKVKKELINQDWDNGKHKPRVTFLKKAAHSTTKVAEEDWKKTSPSIGGRGLGLMHLVFLQHLEERTG